MDKNESPDLRIAIFADTHGMKDPIEKVLRDQGPFDFFIHLGDGVEDGAAVSEKMRIPFYGVRGNEDYGTKQKEQCFFALHQWTCLLFHGDQMDLNPFHSKAIWDNNYEKMYRMARRENASILLFGHTHQPLLKRIDNIILCNPGSPSVHYIQPPTPSFGIITANKKGVAVSILEKSESLKWIIRASEQLYG